MKRRNFIKTISTAAIAGSIFPVTAKDDRILPNKKLKKPARLKKGNTIALVTPGSYITDQEKQESIINLQSLGFNVVYTDRLMQKNGYFSANDEERAKDLNDMFERKDVHAIMCARGGYGCSRILPYIDYDLIEDNPKALIGFSDVTALQYAIYKNSGLLTFHGPVSISTFSNFSVKNFESVLMNPTFEFDLMNSTTENNYNPYGITIISEGKSEGKLIGGNLSICVSLIGTEFDIDYSDKIVFLEEFIEEPYRVDRMLTQMIQSGKFENAAGIALGVFKLCEPNKSNPAFQGSFSLMEVLQDRLGNLGIPVIYGLSFGHVADKFTLPFGGYAELNTETKRLKLLEPAVH